MGNKLKRVLLILAGAVTALLGTGSIISALLGYYGGATGLIAGIAVFGALLAGLGVFLVRLGVWGTDRDVADTDLL